MHYDVAGQEVTLSRYQTRHAVAIVNGDYRAVHPMTHGNVYTYSFQCDSGHIIAVLKLHRWMQIIDNVTEHVVDGTLVLLDRALGFITVYVFEDCVCQTRSAVVDFVG